MYFSWTAVNLLRQEVVKATTTGMKSRSQHKTLDFALQLP
jgi:hypothetical protein